MNRDLRALLQVSFIILTSSVALGAMGQVPSYNEAGYKPFGSYDGSTVDVVNLDNLNLSLDIPLFSLPQRGRLALSYSLPYTNPGWNETSTCVEHVCSYTIAPATSFTPPFGPTLDQRIAVLQQTSSTGQTNTVATNETLTYYNVNYSIVDSRSGTHVLLYENGIFRAADGSGWLFIPSYPNPDIPFGTDNSSSYVPGVAIDKDGNRYTFTTPSGGGNATLTSIQDADGNAINQSPSSFTDSFGRQNPININNNVSTAGCPNLNNSLQIPTSASTWTVPGANGGSNTYLFCYTQVYIHTDFVGGTSGSGNQQYFADWVGSRQMLQSVVLPNGTFWGFLYDSAGPSNSTTFAYGDLTQLILPTGGSISYVWQTGTLCSSGVQPASPPSGTVTPLPRSLVSRTVNAGNGLPPSTTTYSNSSNNTNNYPFTYVATVTNPDNSTVQHTFTDLSAKGTCSLYETATQYNSFINGSLVTTENTASQYQVASQYNPATQTAPLLTQKTITWPNGQSSYSTISYDPGYPSTSQICDLQANNAWYCIVTQNGNAPVGKPTLQSDYDFNGQLLRQTSTSYLWQTNTAYLNANLLETPVQVSVSGPTTSGTMATAAQTNYTYDQSSQIGLMPSIAPPDNGYSAATGSVFGHATTVRKWLNNGGVSPSTQMFWLETGKIDHSIDANGYTTSYTYDSTGEFPSSVTYPATASAAHQEWFSFDPVTAKPIWHTDQNGNGPDDPAHTTQYSYDSFGNLTAESFPDGGNLSINYNNFTNPLTVNTTVANGYSQWPVPNFVST